MKNSTGSSYWFKRRRYGYGWTPVSRQGWLTVAGFLAVVFLGAVIILQDTPKNTLTEEAFIFLAFLVAATVILVAISLAKGPKPKWRWGSKPTDNPSEDV